MFSRSKKNKYKLNIIKQFLKKRLKISLRKQQFLHLNSYNLENIIFNNKYSPKYFFYKFKTSIFYLTSLLILINFKFSRYYMCLLNQVEYKKRIRYVKNYIESKKIRTIILPKFTYKVKKYFYNRVILKMYITKTNNNNKLTFINIFLKKTNIKIKKTLEKSINLYYFNLYKFKYINKKKFFKKSLCIWLLSNLNFIINCKNASFWKTLFKFFFNSIYFRFRM